MKHILLILILLSVLMGCSTVAPIGNHRLVDDWYVQQGGRKDWIYADNIHFCKYDDGVVINVGAAGFFSGKCPSYK